MARSNGGIIGKRNVTSFGKGTTSIHTTNTPSAVTTQSGTRVANILVLGGGGGGGGNTAGGGGAGGLMFQLLTLELVVAVVEQDLDQIIQELMMDNLEVPEVEDLVVLQDLLLLEEREPHVKVTMVVLV